MTIINRFCPELSDIVAVRLECKHCHVTLSYPPSDWKPAYLKCPNCGATLVSASPQSKELVLLGELADALRRLANAGDLEFQLRLEFDRCDD